MSSNNPQTREWQALSSDHHLAPFSDFKQLEEKGPRIITKAQGVYLWDSEGNKILDGMAGLWCVAIGYGRDELADAAAKQMSELPLLQPVLPDRPPAGAGAGQGDLRRGAGRHEPRVLHRFRLRRQRHHAAHGPPLLGDQGPAEQENHHQPQERLPRLHRGRRQPRRHDVHARAGRLADPGHRPHRPAVLVRRRRRHEPGRVRRAGPPTSWKRRFWNWAWTTSVPLLPSRSRAPAA